MVYKIVSNENHVIPAGRTHLKDIPGNQSYLEGAVSSYGFEIGVELPIIEDHIRYVFEQTYSQRERRYFEYLLNKMEFTAINFSELQLALLKASLPEGFDPTI